ncbi:helix-turn-helix transcriptional regulator [Marinomonas foliarum]|nr:AlpA family transcriptional regulator [Marinomonas foliarum]
MKGINMRVMKLNEVINTTGLSRSSIYAYMSNGNFPKPIQLGPRAVGWIEVEVREWLQEKLNARNC